MDDSAGASDARTDLIRGAIRVIADKGLRGLTLRAAAAEAGLTHGLIVHYFGTRDSLIEAAMQFAVDQSLAGTLASAEGGAPVLGDHVVEVGVDADGTLAFQREILNEALRRPELRTLAVRMYEKYEAAVRDQLGALGVTDPDAVVLVGAAMDGLARRQMDLGDVAATERAVTLMRSLVGLLRASDASAH